MNFQGYQSFLYSALIAQQNKFNEYVIEGKSDLDFNTELNYIYQIVVAGVDVENSFPYTPIDTVVDSFLKVAKANTGLMLNPSEQLCYLRTEYSYSTGFFHTVLDFGYKRLLKLASRSGKVIAISANIFYKTDTFTYNGQFEKVTHKAHVLSTSARGYVASGYCATLLTNGTYITTVLPPPEELFAIEGSGKASRNKAWHSVFVDQMRWKTLCTSIYADTILDVRDLWETQPVEMPVVEPIIHNDYAQGAF